MADEHLKELRQKFGGLALALKAAETVNSSNPQESQSTRNVIESVPVLAGLVNYSDPQSVLNAIGTASTYYNDVTKGYFQAEKEPVFTELRAKESNLVKGVLAVSPQKTGDAKHDARAEAHSKLKGLVELHQKVKDEKEDPAKIREVTERYIAENIDALAKPSEDPNSKYLSADFLDKAKKTLLYAVKTDPRTVNAFYQAAINSANDKFGKLFANDGEKADYVITNLRKLGEAKPLEAVEQIVALVA